MPDTDTERAQAKDRSKDDRLREAGSLLRQHLGLEALHGVLVPRELDQKTLAFLAEGEEKAS